MKFCLRWLVCDNFNFSSNRRRFRVIQWIMNCFSLIVELNVNIQYQGHCTSCECQLQSTLTIIELINKRKIFPCDLFSHFCYHPTRAHRQFFPIFFSDLSGTFRTFPGFFLVNLKKKIFKKKIANYLKRRFDVSAQSDH